MTPLSISNRKLFASLARSKNRKETGLFMVEGEKAFAEMLDSPLFSLYAVAATREWWENAGIKHKMPDNADKYVATGKYLVQMSGLVSAPDVIGVFRLPKYQGFDVEEAARNLVLALDDVQDPGNLGTIIRLADWWGVDTILCSHATADPFNPKVVQAAMGALGRVRVIKLDSLSQSLTRAAEKAVPVYGTYMNGENLFDAELTQTGIIVMGNEGNGISAEVGSTITRRLTIPSYPPGRRHVESLNVGTATAIVLARFRSRG